MQQAGGIIEQNENVFLVPEGGIASFFDPVDAEPAPLRDIAEMLATKGRFEDAYMVHAAEGETVVPMAVFEENPGLKAALWAQMEEMGIDPERYVVGSELNSINPDTGQPEFFLKKIFKGVGKALKGVVKTFKKFAPTILSIGLAAIPGIGPIAAAALGGGIGTLVQGGSVKDAFKNALIGGVTGGVLKGVTGGIGALSKGGNFFSGAKAGFMASDAAGVWKAGVDAAAGGAAPATGAVAAQGAQAAQGATQALSPADAAVKASLEQAVPAQAATPASGGILGGLQDAAGNVTDKAKGIWDKYLDPTRLDKSPVELAKAAEAAAKEAGYASLDAAPKALQDAILAEASKGPGMLAKYGPLAAAGAGVMALSGGFDAKEPEVYEDPWFKEQRAKIAANPEQYQFFVPDGSNYSAPIMPTGGDQFGGSSIFAKYLKDGGAVKGPGTETSDDVPAWLSDGEFVMTAKAVRGAGAGDRKEGVKTLMQVMKSLEARA